MILVFYISGHGFGHATRDLVVIDQLQQHNPAIRVVIRSAVPQWFLDRSARTAIVVEPCETDTGVAQIDSLRLDERETARRANDFYGTFSARVETEARALERLQPSAVVGDVPPLAFAAAARAGVPSIALANFTWDWIYEAYSDEFRDSAPDAIATMRDAYATTTLALRLPFAGGFEPMRAVTRDVPLVARRSRSSREDTRQRLGISSERPVVLASFGGHGASLAFEEIARMNDVTVIVTDYESRRAPAPEGTDGRLRRFTKDTLDHLAVRYEDLVAAADIVVSKPGYGIVSECIANDTALLYTSRGHFAENDVLVTAMSRVLRCRFIHEEDLRAGHWNASVSALLSQPDPPERMASDGAATVASLLLEVSKA